jgi:hypothetical protein
MKLATGMNIIVDDSYEKFNEDEFKEHLASRLAAEIGGHDTFEDGTDTRRDAPAELKDDGEYPVNTTGAGLDTHRDDRNSGDGYTAPDNVSSPQ